MCDLFANHDLQESYLISNQLTGLTFLGKLSLQSRRIWGYDKGYEYSMPPSWMMKLKEGWGEAKKDFEGEDDGLHPPLLH